MSTRLTKLVAILAWAAALAWLLLGQHVPGARPTPPYLFFLRASLWPLPALALGVLLVLGTAALGEVVWRRETGRSAAAPPRLRHGARAALVLLPLAFLWTASVGGLGADALRTRNTPVMIRPTAHQAGVPDAHGDLDLRDVTTPGVVAAGREVQVLGQVAHERAGEKTQITLFRFMVMCCVADAVPVAVRVTAADAAQWRDDTWVRIHGTLRTTPEGQAVIEAARIERVTPPANPYLYPF